MLLLLLLLQESSPSPVHNSADFQQSELPSSAASVAAAGRVTKQNLHVSYGKSRGGGSGRTGKGASCAGSGGTFLDRAPHASPCHIGIRAG